LTLVSNPSGAASELPELHVVLWNACDNDHDTSVLLDL